MGTGRLLSYFEYLKADGHVEYGGSRSKYKEKSLSEPAFDNTYSLPVNTTRDVWGFSAEEPISDFDIAFILSDKDGLYVELTTDKANVYGTEPFTLGIDSVFPLILPSKRSFANYVADFGGGTVAAIDRIRIHNPSDNAAGTANVRVVLFT